MSERARALDQSRETALRTDATYLSPSGRIVRVQGHKLTGRILLDSRGRVAVRNIDTDRLSYVHQADLRELAIDPPPSGASPQAETSEQDVPVLRITVTRDVATEYYAAEFRSADDKVGGMGDYSATPVGALANLCATLIQIDEDNSVERRQPAPVSPVEPTPEPPTDQLRETPMGHRIFRHVCGTPEDDGECMACSQIDCPDGEPLHYHHDGCPCCSQKPTGAPAPCVWREVNPPMGPVRRMRPGCRKTAQTFTLPLVEAWKVCPYCGAPLKVEREP